MSSRRSVALAKAQNFLPVGRRHLEPAQVMPTGGVGPAGRSFRDGWWFEPLAPTAPLAPLRQQPRRFEYVPGKNLIWTPREGAGVSFEMLRSLSFTLDVLRVVIEHAKGTVRNLAWDIRPKRQKDENSKEYAARSKEDPNIATLKSFFEYPDGENSFDSWLNMLLEDMMVIDAPSILLRRDKQGKIALLQIVDGATITPLVNIQGFTPRPPDPAFYQVLYGAPAFLLTTDDLVYAPYNRVNRGANDLSLYGFPPVEFVLYAINQLLRREQFSLEFFTSGSVPEALAGVPSDWSVKQIEQLQAWFDSVESGNLAARRKVRFIPTVAGGIGDRMNVVFPKINDQSLKSEYEEWLTIIICNAFKISKEIFVRAMTRATAETSKKTSEEQGYYGWKLHLENTLNLILQQKMGMPEYEFTFREKEQSDPTEQSTILTTYLKVGAITVNELREDLGRDPFPIETANQPAIYTASGTIPLEPQEDEIPPKGSPGPDEPGSAGAPPHSPGDSGAVAEKRHRAAIAPASTNPLYRRLQKKLEDLMARIHARMYKELLQAPQLEETRKADESDEARDQLIDALITKILAGYTDARAELEQILKETGNAGILEAAIESGQLAPTELSPLYRSAADYASKHAADLVTQISETTREALRSAITDALKSPTPMSELIRRIESAGTFNHYRAGLIARTETSNAMIKAAMETWKAADLTKYIRWETAENPCPICAQNRDAVVKLGEPFPSGATSPLQHPNCLCLVVAEPDYDPSRSVKKSVEKEEAQQPLYLLRHGSTILNEQNRIRGWTSAPLSAGGREASMKAAERLRHRDIHRVVSSDLRRAKETANIVGKSLRVPVDRDKDLNALDVGKMAGEPKETSGIERYIQNPDEKFPGGETLNDFKKRAVKSILKYREQAQDDGPILLVAHNSVLMALRQFLTGAPPKPDESDPVPPGGIMRLDGDKLSVVE